MTQNGVIDIYNIKTATEYVISNLEVPIMFSTSFSVSLFMYLDNVKGDKLKILEINMIGHVAQKRLSGLHIDHFDDSSGRMLLVS